MRKAILDGNNVVVNVVELDDAWSGLENEWQPPANHTVVDAGISQPGDTWDNVQFNRASPTLSDVKETKCGVVNYLYLGQYATCTHLGFTWGADALSAGKIAAKFHVYNTINAGSAPNTTMWADHGGVHRELSWADFTSLRERIFVFHEDAFANMKAHKAAINALGTVAAVDAYDISTGWPV